MTGPTGPQKSVRGSLTFTASTAIKSSTPVVRGRLFMTEEVHVDPAVSIPLTDEQGNVIGRVLEVKQGLDGCLEVTMEVDGESPAGRAVYSGMSPDYHGAKRLTYSVSEPGPEVRVGPSDVIRAEPAEPQSCQWCATHYDYPPKATCVHITQDGAEPYVVPERCPRSRVASGEHSWTHSPADSRERSRKRCDWCEAVVKSLPEPRVDDDESWGPGPGG